MQRELWENRAVYVAPLAVAGLIILGSLIGARDMANRVYLASALDAMQRIDAIARPYNMAATAIMGTTLLVGIFYCLGALHSERRDRSILFWKSLPVSDLTTVLAKASIPIVAIPAITFVVTVAVQAAMLAFETAAVAGRGMSPQQLWSNLPVFSMWLMLLYHLVTVHAIWYAPIFAWLLLVSAWARRAPFLWASVPLLAVGIVGTGCLQHVVLWRAASQPDWRRTGELELHEFRRRNGRHDDGYPVGLPDQPGALDWPGLHCGMSDGCGAAAAAAGAI